MRFGAVAAEKLGLAQAGATHFYSVYPAHVQDPVAALRQAINEAGMALHSSQVEALLQELPGAVRSASLLMTALAHRD
ncbi:uncharacterized protein HaLaN_15081 [Haematococcus lacustris]|uniref:Uncharacterized protein n=1 Tax=Haematococcus lacustris TaxID=44745 RepID=A0A699ZGV7_HAELA|nr:uncharacterized protein HaLaN_15081 [Haematococcus lacustris]